jgi:hemerythrin-like metal-binding protein
LSGNTESAPELVEQLFTYTQAHFLYEQLLMRRTARPNYAGHVQEHDRLMRQLHTVRDRTRDADYAAAVAQLKAHGEDLIEHISSWDMSIE